MRGKKRTIEEVRYYIEVESCSGCILLSTDYKNVDTKLKLQCSCGVIFYKTFAEFLKLERKMCRGCILKNTNKNTKIKKSGLIGKKKDVILSEIDNLIKEKSCNCILLSTEYLDKRTPLKIKCSCNNIFENSLDELQMMKLIMCKECKKKRRVETQKEKIINKVQSMGFKFIRWVSDYNGSKTRFLMECPNGHIIETCIKNLSPNRSVSHCYKCGIESRSGENSFFWEGGKTDLYRYFRGLLDNWKKDSMIKCKYKCIITGGEFDEIHHLYGFNLILEETFNICNLQIRKNIGEYSEEERKLLEKTCLDLHYKYGLGVCLNREIHKLFHDIYGYRDNTPEQFEEFKQRYFNGEFKEVV